MFLGCIVTQLFQVRLGGVAAANMYNMTSFYMYLFHVMNLLLPHSTVDFSLTFCIFFFFRLLFEQHVIVLCCCTVVQGLWRFGARKNMSNYLSWLCSNGFVHGWPPSSVIKMIIPLSTSLLWRVDNHTISSFSLLNKLFTQLPPRPRIFIHISKCRRWDNNSVHILC